MAIHRTLSFPCVKPEREAKARRPVRGCSPLRNPPPFEKAYLRHPVSEIYHSRRHKAKVLLLVPPYTRIEKPYSWQQANYLLGSSANNLKLDSKIIRWFEQNGLLLSEMKRVGPPMGLLRIGSAAKKAGCEVRIIDAAKEGFDNEETLIPEIGLKRYGLPVRDMMRWTSNLSLQVVGIAASYTHQWGNVRELAEEVKRLNQRAVVVVGGAHATGDYQRVLLDSSVDFVVVGQGEETFVELISALEGRRSIGDVRGIAFRSGRHRDEVVFTGHRPFSKNPSNLILDYSLLDLSKYSGLIHTAGARKKRDGLLAYVSTSSGCNQNCGFCAIPKVQGPFLGAGIDQLNAELAGLKKNGVTELIVEDDNWLYNPMWALETCALFKKYDFAWMEEGGLALSALIALNLGYGARNVMGSELEKPSFKHIREAIGKGITAERLITAMAQSGCYSVYLAVESANEAAMEISGKPKANIMQEQAAQIVRLFKNRGISVTGGFMLGFCGQQGKGVYSESAREMINTMEYAGELMRAGMDYANPFIVTPLPGTRMGEFQMQYASTNYDTGFSHELGTFDLPGSLTAEQMGLLRQIMIAKINGIEKMERMLETGSWPV
ncbi:B12-binding domain-containing radical SAM protein [Candidatus Micrarchaeota archaeon]|nr:B12-binding domain-containing radical SAM protein [Candidatus Micrarchaeota archaeon]